LFKRHAVYTGLWDSHRKGERKTVIMSSDGDAQNRPAIKRTDDALPGHIMVNEKIQSIKDQIKNLRDQRERVALRPCATREDRILRAEAMSMIDQTIRDLELIIHSAKPSKQQ